MSSNTDPQPSPPDITQAYWHFLLTEGKRPASVYGFTEKLGISEEDFYQQASSFESLESRYWLSLVEETIAVLDSDDDYPEYPAEQKLLAFYYTFIAHAQKHRSRLVEFFPRPGCYQSVKAMRQRFVAFASEIITQGLEEGSIADRKKLTEKYPQLMFEQLRSVIEFYRKDHSEEFQDTDAFIEKSVRLGADLSRSGSLDSAIDLGRFLLRRFTLPDA
ncbi:hypothetical protein JO972_15745 [Verrucomicrobiaceae bacterium 5K15]|uniref:Tetracyclin repressor-like C-terminal domain-containing protein n=1 Tax=Oceaniferula flava TaxID=2800421 RepID=A0AAE2VF00_9BACT|nr:TetR family transcriptional regulator C-terminal domain-containing protein [Oceaniferula flavus]MBK1856424.1 hypothetical protein [Oceaniferula flavus]MBM1137731.1 hypothetical protein [Oceaniferula flavus]